MSELNDLADKLRTEGEKFFALFAGLTDADFETMQKNAAAFL